MMPSLLSLPTELLRRIASFLPCSAVLSLIRVNYKLRKACDDRLVFHHIAEKAHLYAPVSKVLIEDNMIQWPEGAAFLENASLEDTIRVAYAVERALSKLQARDQQWCKSHDDIGIPRDIREWLPHLMALNHPACLKLRPEDLLLLRVELVPYIEDPSVTAFNKEDQDPEALKTFDELNERLGPHLINIGFCVTRLILEHLRTNQNPVDLAKSIVRHVSPGPSDGMDWLDLATSHLAAFVPGYGKSVRCFALLHASALVPLLLLNIAWAELVSRWQLPRPIKIPFNTFMDIPALYRQTSGAFSTCHFEKMITPEFLSGRWMGYYTDQREGTLIIESPMVNINIVARLRGPSDRPAQSIKAIIDRASSGQDRIHDFVFYGEVAEDGRVDMAKVYLALGREWDSMWRGTVTPFGLVGQWGSMGLDFGGYFWMWKEEWTL